MSEASLVITDERPLAGRDVAALALMPVTVATSQQDQKRWHYSYQLQVDGKTRRFDVTLEPGSGVGWPTHDDQVVYLALLQLAVQTAAHTKLECKRPDVWHLLGWPAQRGHYYERFRDSLQRLTGLTVYITSSTLAKNGKAYSRSDQGAGLIDSFHIAEGHNATVTIEWGKLVREAFALDDLKRLDWDMITALANPLTVQLYRLLDRVKLAGEATWEVGWKPLAKAIGMNTNYARPARFRDVLRPALERLIEQGVVAGVDYQRGGMFTFHLQNYLRTEVRRVLETLGAYDQATVQLMVGYDIAEVMAQADCLMHGNRQRPQQPGGYLVEAIRQNWDLRYPEDDAEAFAGMWSLLNDRERHGYHLVGLDLCEIGADDLFATRPDPTAWPEKLRAVCRFMICHGIDPERIKD